MARIRYVKPGFFTNDDLARCSHAARLLFIGLWTIADREGRLEDRPQRIKAEVFPLDSCDTDSLLNELNAIGAITRYECERRKFIAIPNFGKHQRPHNKEPKSTIPAPTKHRNGRGKTRKGAPQPEPLPHEPDGNGEWGMGNGELEREQEKDAAASPCDFVSIEDAENSLPTPKNKSNDPPGFDDFWQAYPRKAARKSAVRAWVKLKPKPELQAEIANAARVWADAFVFPADLTYCPHPATWLNGERWKEEPPKSGGQARASPATPAERFSHLKKYVEKSNDGA